MTSQETLRVALLAACGLMLAASPVSGQTAEPGCFYGGAAPGEARARIDKRRITDPILSTPGASARPTVTATTPVAGTPVVSDVALNNSVSAAFSKDMAPATLTTIADGGVMVGTIIASAGMTISTAGQTAQTTLVARALRLIASVTIVNTTIVAPAP